MTDFLTASKSPGLEAWVSGSGLSILAISKRLGGENEEICVVEYKINKVYTESESNSKV